MFFLIFTSPIRKWSDLICAYFSRWAGKKPPAKYAEMIWNVPVTCWIILLQKVPYFQHTFNPLPSSVSPRQVLKNLQKASPNVGMSLILKQSFIICETLLCFRWKGAGFWGLVFSGVGLTHGEWSWRVKETILVDNARPWVGTIKSIVELFGGLKTWGFFAFYV